MLKIRRFLILTSCLLALALALPLSAQEDEPRRESPADIVIESVTLVSNDPFTLAITGTQVCDTPLNVMQSQQENVFFVDLTTEEDAQDAVCSSEPIAFELEVELEIDPEVLATPEADAENVDQTLMSRVAEYVIFVNEYVVGYNPVNFGEATPEATPAELVPLAAVPVIVEDVQVVSLESDPPIPALHVVGQNPDACPAQQVIRQEITEDGIEVRIVRVQGLVQACPMMLVFYDNMIPLAVDPEGVLEGIYTITVNDVELVYDFTTGETIQMANATPFPLVIENVEALILQSFPPQIQITVTGYQQDGCDFPVQVEQRQEGDTVYVEIFRLMPPNVRCPRNILPYEDTINLGSFEVGTTYQIDVNGTVIEVEL